ncbi:UPF0280 family protein [bacterium]|nr:UPF0280 family protein [bacterium]MBU1064875.1 UPF0280 family protein [bacterium]MBU1635855.1 UPF0280 family protein [bacterium]MBU1873476.1 UPF0280 family protein [bacterium]
MYEERIYRNSVKSNDLTGFQVMVMETDLYISAERDLSTEALVSVHKYRMQIQQYISENPEFQTTLKPYKVNNKAPQIIKEMASASSSAGVGPFASVAGALAEYVANDLLIYSDQIIIENGGDIYIKSNKNRLIGIYAGPSTLSNKLAIEINADETPLGVCTSSGTFGHSFSFGRADAVVIISKSTLIADAVATAVCNLIQNQSDIKKGIEFVKIIKAVYGVIIIKDAKIGIWGNIQIRKIN